MTFNKPQQTNKSSIVNCQLSIVEILLSSHETCVNYMMPLGLHHIFAWEHHYGPEPWCDIPGPVNTIAGVANIGDDINWTGHHFAQANWYAFGRQAWNHQITSKQIAEEWVEMTFSPSRTLPKGRETANVKTQNLKPETLKPETRNPKPETLKHGTLKT